MSVGSAEICEAEVSDDAFLGGALMLLQPKAGYRAGVDAVLLAAAVPDNGGRPARALDVGAGVGTAGLCLARRCPGISAALLEREPELVELARRNVERNGIAERCSVAEADLGDCSDAELSALGIAAGSFDHVIANPPFHVTSEGTAARAPLKANAHAMTADGLERWARFLARMTKPGGTATVIHKAETLAELLSAMDARFGALRILPVHAQAEQPAIRVVVQGIKGSKAPSLLLAPLVLHNESNKPSAAAEAITRHGKALDLSARAR